MIYLNLKQCPVCREPITKPPVRSRTLDNAIERVVATLTDKDKQNWEERIKAQSKQAEEVLSFNIEYVL